MALLGGLAIPRHPLGRVPANALSRDERVAELVLGFGVAPLGAGAQVGLGGRRLQGDGQGEGEEDNGPSHLVIC